MRIFLIFLLCASPLISAEIKFTKINELRKNEFHTDIKILSHDKDHYAHKIKLGEFSLYFETLCSYDSFLENKTNTIKFDCSGDIAERILDYIYGVDRIRNNLFSQRDYLDLISFANMSENEDLIQASEHAQINIKLNNNLYDFFFSLLEHKSKNIIDNIFPNNFLPLPHVKYPVNDPNHGGTIKSITFSPDGTRFIAPMNDSKASWINVWDAKDPQLLLVLRKHSDNAIFYSVSFSPDGSLIASASHDTTAIVWDAYTGEALLVLKHEGPIRYVAFSPDSKRLITASHDKTAKVWDAQNGEMLSVLEGHSDKIRLAFFSPDGSQIITASDDRTAIVWDAQTYQWLFDLKGFTGYTSPTSLICYSPSGDKIAMIASNNTAMVHNAQSGDLLFTLEGHGAALSSINFNSSGQKIITASLDKTARIWDAQTGNFYSSLEEDHYLSSAFFSPNEEQIVTFSSSGAQLYDSQRSKIFLIERANMASFSFDNTRIVAANGYFETLKLWYLEPLFLSDKNQACWLTIKFILISYLKQNQDHNYQGFIDYIKSNNFMFFNTDENNLNIDEDIKHIKIDSYIENNECLKSYLIPLFNNLLTSSPQQQSWGQN